MNLKKSGRLVSTTVTSTACARWRYLLSYLNKRSKNLIFHPDISKKSDQNRQFREQIPIQKTHEPFWFWIFLGFSPRWVDSNPVNWHSKLKNSPESWLKKGEEPSIIRWIFQWLCWFTGVYLWICTLWFKGFLQCVWWHCSCFKVMGFEAENAIDRNSTEIVCARLDVQ